MSLTNFAELELLDHVLGGGDYARPATVHIALSTTAINEDGSGITEPVGNGYARAAVTNDATNWPAATTNGSGKGEKSNGTAITYAETTGSWGTVSDFAIFDAASGGNMIAKGKITDGAGTPTPVAINSGVIPRFAAGTLVITLD